MNIPLSEPDITEAEIEEVVTVLRSTRLSLGPKMEEFEASVSSYVGQPFGIAVSSGTAGLHLCIRALGIGSGDEVIVPSFTFIAAANAILYEGATPVFVDIDHQSLNLDPVRVEEAITTRTRAIIVVHTFGVPAAMDDLLDIAARHHLRIIEDACEAIGAEYDGRRVGAFGDAAVFAFYPNKQITTGEGGMVVTRDQHLATEIRAMRITRMASTFPSLVFASPFASPDCAARARQWRLRGQTFPSGDDAGDSGGRSRRP